MDRWSSDVLPGLETPVLARGRLGDALRFVWCASGPQTEVSIPGRTVPRTAKLGIAVVDCARWGFGGEEATIGRRESGTPTTTGGSEGDAVGEEGCPSRMNGIVVRGGTSWEVVIEKEKGRKVPT